MPMPVNDFVIFVPNYNLNALGKPLQGSNRGWVPVPRNCHLVDTIITQKGPFDGGAGIKITSAARGDLSDEFLQGGGAAGDTHIVTHRPEAANHFDAGSNIEIECTNTSAGDHVNIMLVCRPE